MRASRRPPPSLALGTLSLARLALHHKIPQVKKAVADRAASVGGEAEDGAPAAPDAGAGPPPPPRDDDGTLSEAALRELFKKTTSSNLRNALATGEWDWYGGEEGRRGAGGALAFRKQRRSRCRHRSALSQPSLSLSLSIHRQDDADAFYSDEETDLRGFWSDGENAEAAAPPPARRGRKAGGGGGKPPRPPRGAKAGGGAAGPPAPPRAHHHLVSSGAGVAQVIRRRAARAADPDALYALRVPRPLPLSWGRTVAPYVSRSAVAAADAAVLAAGEGKEATPDDTTSAAAAFVPAPRGDVPALFASPPPTGPLAPGARTWQALLVNCGWEAGIGGGAAAAAAAAAAGGPAGARGGPPGAVPPPTSALASFSTLPIPSIVPSGFVFAWVRKEHIAPVTAQMHAWGFAYIETLAWVWLGPDGDVLALPAPVTARSHATLMIYRKGAEEVELRHQRSPDVVFDCVVGGGMSAGGPVAVPPEVYAAIETMLPFTAGRRLELWAAPPGAARAAGSRGLGGGRPGWTHVFAAA